MTTAAHLLVPAAAFAAAWLVGAPARAEKPHDDSKRDDEWQLSLFAHTSFPLDAGGGASIETPGRARLTSTVGALTYMPWVSGVAVGLGAYDAATGQMIKTALRGSLVWRLQAGIRPWKDAHWYFEAGYCSVLLGGSVATPGSVATFLRPPASGIPIPPSYTIDAKVHMASVEVGYEHDYANHVQVRVAFGFSGAFAADVTVQMPGFGSNEYVHRVEDSLAGLLRSYSFTPTLTLSGGFWAR